MTETLTLQSITIGHKTAVEQLYRTYGRHDSAHAFASLFLWKKNMDLSLCLMPGAYTVRSGWKGQNSWFYPCGEPEARKECLAALIRRGCRSLCYLQQEDTEELENLFPDMFTIREAPDDSEYLYDRDGSLNMSGSQFVKMRNLYRRLQKEHEVSSVPITERDLPAVRNICREWQERRGDYISMMWRDVTDVLLDNWTALDAKGTILRMDGEDWAVSAGYPLDENTFDCCLHNTREKIPGMTENLRIAFVRACPEHISCFNYEEDLGREGLRLAKERLRPSAMIRMYTGERKV